MGTCVVRESDQVHPSPLDFWLAYLELQSDLSHWSTTFESALVNWQLDLCWQLLREARRWAETPAQRGTVRYYEGRFCAQNGDWSRSENCYRMALEEIPPADVEMHLALLGEMGMLERVHGNGHAALVLHRRQLAQARSCQAVDWQAEALDQLGMDYELLNNWEEARQALQQALTLYKEQKDTEGIAGCSNRLGLVAFRQDHLDEAEIYLEQARDLFEQLERPYEAAQVEGNLGNVSYARDDWSQAERHYHSALELFNTVGVLFDKIGVLNNLGSLALARANWKQAKRFYQASLALSRDLGDRREERDVLINLGVSNVRRGHWDEAACYYSQALALTRELLDRGAILDLRKRQLRLWLLQSLDWLSKKVRGKTP